MEYRTIRIKDEQAFSQEAANPFYGRLGQGIVQQWKGGDHAAQLSVLLNPWSHYKFPSALNAIWNRGLNTISTFMRSCWW